MPRIAVLQMDGSQENLSRAEALVAEAARAGADFALLPELSNVPWLPAREEGALLHFAEPEDGPAVQAYREIAARYRINLVAPIYEEDRGFRYSTAFVIDRDGTVIGKYRKNHIPYVDGWYEKFYYAPGDSGYPVFEHEGLRFGIQICWDNMFIEGSRILALKGAQVIFSPRATGPNVQRWRGLLTTNAFVNHLFIATANRVGEDRGTGFGGGSFIVGPKGTVLAEVEPSAAPGITVAEIDLTSIASAVEANPFFANRRPTLYKALVKG